MVSKISGWINKIGLKATVDEQYNSAATTLAEFKKMVDGLKTYIETYINHLKEQQATARNIIMCYEDLFSKAQLHPIARVVTSAQPWKNQMAELSNPAAVFSKCMLILNSLQKVFDSFKVRCKARDHARTDFDLAQKELNSRNEAKAKYDAAKKPEPPKEAEARRSAENKFDQTQRVFHQLNDSVKIDMMWMWERRFEILGPVLLEFICCAKHVHGQQTELANIPMPPLLQEVRFQMPSTQRTDVGNTQQTEDTNFPMADLNALLAAAGLPPQPAPGAPAPAAAAPAAAPAAYDQYAAPPVEGYQQPPQAYGQPPEGYPPAGYYAPPAGAAPDGSYPGYYTQPPAHQ